MAKQTMNTPQITVDPCKNTKHKKAREFFNNKKINSLPHERFRRHMLCEDQDTEVYFSNAHLMNIEPKHVASKQSSDVTLPPKVVPTTTGQNNRPLVPETPPAPQLVSKTCRLTELELTLKLAMHEKIGMYGDALFIRTGDVYEPLTSIGAMRALQEILPFEESKGFTSRSSDGILPRLKSLPEITSNKLLIPHGKVLFCNGCYDIIENAPAKVEDSDFFVSRVAADYITNANDIPDTPMFDAFLESVSGGDASIIDLMLAVLGYLLLPGAEAKKLFVLGTAEDSGKSLFGQLVAKLLDESVVSAIPIQSFSKDFVAANIVGKQANISMDVPSGVIPKNAIAMIKAITGHDLITINQKHTPVFTYRSFASLVFGTNSPIRIVDDDRAFWNRVIVVPFLNTVPVRLQDPRLLERLLEERDGIVNRAMIAASQLLINDYEFPYCAISEKMKAQWKRESDITIVKRFAQEFCSEDPDSFVSTDELYREFRKNNPQNQISTKAFSQGFGQFYGKQSTRHKIGEQQFRGFQGISLRKDL